MTERLFRMLAASHGGLWHASPIGASLGLSYHTVNSYLEHIQGAFLVRLLGHLSSHGRDHEACFFRTSDGYEIDLVLEFGRARWAIEIKLTTAPSPADLDRLVRTADLIGATRCCLVSRTSRPARSPAVLSADPLGLLAVLDEA
jgi:predicted AAA+ superfamily ATPase